MACENCLSRRDFLARSALAAAAVALAEACGDGQIGPPLPANNGGPIGTPPAGGNGGFTIKIADFPGLNTVGNPVILGSAAPERAVVRVDASTFLGLSIICTHEGCDLGVDGQTFLCHCHGSRFSHDGTVINGPNAPGPVGPLIHRDVTVSADGLSLTID